MERRAWPRALSDERNAILWNGLEHARAVYPERLNGKVDGFSFQCEDLLESTGSHDQPLTRVFGAEITPMLQKPLKVLVSIQS